MLCLLRYNMFKTQQIYTHKPCTHVGFPLRPIVCRVVSSGHWSGSVTKQSSLSTEGWGKIIIRKVTEDFNNYLLVVSQITIIINNQLSIILNCLTLYNIIQKSSKYTFSKLKFTR